MNENLKKNQLNPKPGKPVGANSAPKGNFQQGDVE